MVLRISAVERDVARQQGKVADIKRRLALLEAGTPEHAAALRSLDIAETFLYTDTRLLEFMRRRVALYRALGAEHCMPEPLMTD